MLRKTEIGWGRAVGVTTAVLLATVSPYLYQLLAMLAAKSYYAHVPFVLAGAFGYAIWCMLVEERPSVSDERMINDREQSLRGISITAALLLSISVVLVAAVWFFGSVWLSLPALLTGVWGIVHLYGGKALAKLIFPALIICLVSIPLPVGLDQTLVVTLQKLATTLASYWLDLLNIFHVVTGVAIQTPKQAYLVEDACSGISSLFAGIVVTTFYCLWLKYGLIRSVVTISMTVVWLMVTNAVRVFLIVFCSVKRDIDLTEGLVHEALGIFTFASGILLALSTERLLLFLLPRRIAVNDTNRRTIWARIFGWLDIRIGRFQPQTLPFSVALASLLVLVSGFAYAGRLYAKQSSVGSSSVTVTDFSTVTMPESIGNWILQKHEVQQRSPDDVFGMTSYIWYYQRNDQQMAISIDGPYDEWHDLAVCYTSVGWQLQGYENLLASGNEAKSYAVDLHLYREPLDRADVLFACFDRNRQIVPPQQLRAAVLSNFVTRVRKLFNQTVSSFEPPVHQVQVNAQMGDIVSESDRQELEEILLLALGRVGIDLNSDRTVAPDPEE